MADTTELSLWNQFNLVENNPDPGGGILYAIRYDSDTLLTRRDAIRTAIIGSGATIFELDYGLGIDGSVIEVEGRSRFAVLIEELSVLNEAIEYHEADLNVESIAELSQHLRNVFMAGLLTDHLTAFDLVNINIPQIIKDIEIAHNQNDVISREEQTILKDLGKFAATRAEQVAGDTIIIE
jgi:hypothetical protein